MTTLNITVAMTSDGKRQYLQVASQDQTSLNIVLVVDKITIRDVRPQVLSDAEPKLQIGRRKKRLKCDTPKSSGSH